MRLFSNLRIGNVCEVEIEEEGHAEDEDEEKKQVSESGSRLALPSFNVLPLYRKGTLVLMPAWRLGFGFAVGWWLE